MNNNIFSALGQEHSKFLNDNMNRRTFSKGDVIFSPLDLCLTLNVVIKGKIKLCKFSSEGDENIISILEEGGIFGEALVFETLNYPVHVIADIDCTVGMINRETIIKLMQQSEVFTLNIVSELAGKIRILNEKLEYLSYSSVKQRIAKFLMNVSSAQNSKVVRMTLPKQKLAQILGTSREVISRNYSAMKNEGYFEEKDGMVILNIKMLEKIL